MLEIIFSLFGIIIGGGVTFFYLKQRSKNNVDSAEEKAKKLLEDAKSKQQSLLLAAQEQSIKIINDAKLEITEEKKLLKAEKDRLEKREAIFDEKLLSIEDKQNKLEVEKKKVEEEKVKVTDTLEKQLKELERIAGLSREEAKEKMIKAIEDDIKEDALIRVKRIQELTSDDLEREAKQVLMLAIQRFSLPVTVDITTSNVKIPNDEMKGRIIGKEGRNIKIFEQLTGVEIIIDDTPNIITISCFNPIRRHIAKRTLELLIEDGRIQPARIEEFIERVKTELALDIKKSGEDAVAEVNVHGLDSKLIQIIGRLKYRTSYGQNVLQHSIETCILAGLIANEIGADVNVAKKAGLLHDIGKAVDYEMQGNHDEIGKNIAVKFNMPQTVVDAIASHHEDFPTNLEGVIVKVADAISSSRPGSRKDSVENYIQRLSDLEEVATRNKNIQRAFAIAAGRELRVFVDSDIANDYDAFELAKKIARDIESELKYPGEIKVTVIREKRIVEYAK